MSTIENLASCAAFGGANHVAHISPLFPRLSGFALVAGALGFSVHLAARSILTAAAGGGTATFAMHSLWLPINAIGAIGAALAILGLSGVYATFAQIHDRLGLLGSILIGLAWMVLGVFLSLYSMIVLPWLAATVPDMIDGLNSNPAMLVTVSVGLGAEFTGTITLAIALARCSHSCWIGYVLAGSALMLVAGDFVIAPGGPAPNVAINLVSNLGPILLMFALAALGYELAWPHPGAWQAEAHREPS
jgi:hypothetical protein